MFKIGDTVQLKSGGPIMTVNASWPDGTVDCIWFDEKELKQGRFISSTLQAV